MQATEWHTHNTTSEIKFHSIFRWIFGIRNSYINRCAIVQLAVLGGWMSSESASQHSSNTTTSSTSTSSCRSSTITFSLCCWCLRNGAEWKIRGKRAHKKEDLDDRAQIHTLKNHTPNTRFTDSILRREWEKNVQTMFLFLCSLFVCLL